MEHVGDCVASCQFVELWYTELRWRLKVRKCEDRFIKRVNVRITRYPPGNLIEINVG